jgi:hypothetical protein
MMTIIMPLRGFQRMMTIIMPLRGLQRGLQRGFQRGRECRLVRFILGTYNVYWSRWDGMRLLLGT